MNDNNFYKKNRHSCFNLQYHLIMTTKYRKPAINDAVFETIRAAIEKIFEGNGCEIVVLNHDYDHIHMLFMALPQTNLANMINNLKTVTSRLVRRDHPAWLSQFYWKPYFWSRSYFIGTVGDVTTAIVEAYIQSQRGE